MQMVKKGDYVKVHYTGKFDNGAVFESSTGCAPLQVHVGARELLQGFEDALLGMTLNETKTFTLDSSEAYGERDEQLEQTFALSDFPEGFLPQVGEMILVTNQEQDEFPALIRGVEDEMVRLDFNHPLAGKTLTFEVEVMEISDRPEADRCGAGCSCSDR